MDKIKAYTYDVIVIGSGAAGFGALCRIAENKIKTAALVTEGVNWGTSRNTGSDKQTYYKLSLSGSDGDSVRQLAKNMFETGCVDGDIALCEAAESTRCFMRLCDMGIPFPKNEYGEYVGYKTDHDPYSRATSAGPLTSKYMTEAWEKEARDMNLPIYDSFLAVEILKNEYGVCGLLCLDKKSGDFALFKCANIIMATGGPACLYFSSVYPESQTGASSLAISAGAKCVNLTEWQYGLASTKPRWNVSGTYMQALPRLISLDESGKEHEFLKDYFGDSYKALSMLFLKGYQWPFDSEKAKDGSSVIDILVYKEEVLKNRAVYLDYTKNPFGLEDIDFDKLSPEAKEYLEKAGAGKGCPVDRLINMNEPAYKLYLSKGVDLKKERLKISLCAQHLNGGIEVNSNWETNIDGLFAVGECAGTHGIKRSGGTALNSGQVGGLRAAERIFENKRFAEDVIGFKDAASEAVACHREFAKEVICDFENIDELAMSARQDMTNCAAAIRNTDNIKTLIEKTKNLLNAYKKSVSVTKENLYKAYKLKDMLISQMAVLTAMKEFSAHGFSRGGAVYISDRENPLDFLPCSDKLNNKIQVINYKNGEFDAEMRDVRKIPEESQSFEKVWKKYREKTEKEC